MAEVVHKRLEAMLPELEELERIGIFSRQEIKEIVRKRQKYEYRMLRRPAKKEDFLQAIQYELDLEVLRKRRKERHGIITAKDTDSEYGFTSRVHSLFQRALKKFKGDVNLWSQYALFCQKVKHHFALSKALAKALAINPRSAQLWVLAAKAEHEGNRDIEAARTLLQRGIRGNPESTQLWHEVFRLELLHVDRIKRRREVLGLPLTDEQGADDSMVSDDFMNYHSAIAVYHAAVKAIGANVDFRLGFLPILDDFDDVEVVLEDIYSSLTRDFPNSAQCWDAVARQNIRTLDLSICTKSELSEMYEKVAARYRQGLEAMTQDRAKLWLFYINWSVEWSKTVQDEEQSKKILALCKESCSDPQLTAELMEYCLRQVLSVDADQKEVEELCCLATSRFPKEGSLWKLRLSAYCCSHDDGVFRDAIKMVPDCVDVWKYWIEWCIVQSTDKRAIRAVFEDALSCGLPSVSVPMASMYIEWSLVSDGMKTTRKLYKKLLSSHPVALEVYQTCIQIELAQDPRDVKCIRSLYEAAVLEHGRTTPDLWLDYLKSELSFGSKGVTKISSIYWRAKKELDGSLVSEFISQYSLINKL